MANKKKKIQDDIDLDIDISIDDDFDDLDDVKTAKKKNYNKVEIVDDDDEVELTTEERIENIEKKLTIIIILVAITLLFSAANTIVNLSSGSSNGAASGNNSETISYDTSAFKEISAKDISDESKSETIIVWIGHQGCGYCQAYAPTVAKIADEYGVKVRYIDFGKIVNFNVADPYIQDSDAWDTLESLTGSGEWATFVEENLGQTPLTIVINKNKVIGGLVGNDTESNIEQLFKDAGFSK